jgi:hypothetical protein
MQLNLSLPLHQYLEPLTYLSVINLYRVIGAPNEKYNL